MCLDLNRLEENFVAIVDCKSQDSVGEISIILRAVPCQRSVFSDRLPTQITVPISPTESWDLQVLCHAAKRLQGESLLFFLCASISIFNFFSWNVLSSIGKR
jgi:hypothetical protein